MRRVVPRKNCVEVEHQHRHNTNMRQNERDLIGYRVSGKHLVEASHHHVLVVVVVVTDVGQRKTVRNTGHYYSPDLN